MPDYVCQRDGIERAQPICRSIPGAGLELAIGTLLIKTVTPLALEVERRCGRKEGSTRMMAAIESAQGVINALV